MADVTDREALRRRLRAKIRGKRGGEPELPTRLRDDPVTAMLSMGLDDAELLNQAKSIVAQPEAFLSKMTGETTVERKAHRRRRGGKKKTSSEPSNEPSNEPTEETGATDDEEEAPPPPA